MTTTTATPTPAERLRTMIESIGWTIENLPDDLTLDQMGDIARKILAAVDQMEPATPAALKMLSTIARIAGTTAEKVAADLGIDLDTATTADVDRAARALGTEASIRTMVNAAHGEVTA